MNGSERARQTIEQMVGDLELCEVEFSMLVGDAHYGLIGLGGLRLIANCLYARFGYEPIADNVGEVAGSAAIKHRIEDLEATGNRFVICYREHGDFPYRMAWSDDLSPEEAFEEVVAFVECGVDLILV